MNTPRAQLGLRRLRLNPLTRELVRELRLSHEQFIQPHFVIEGIGQREGVSGMPDVYRETRATLLRQIEADLEQGVSKILLFGVPQKSPTPGLFCWQCGFDQKAICNRLTSASPLSSPPIG